jgi:hypothetical protein
MRLTALLAVVCAALPAAAGVRMQTEETDLQTKEVTKQEILIDSDRLRVNMTGKTNTSVLFLTDGGKNRMLMLDRAKNEYTEIDQATIDQMGNQMQGMMSQMANMPPEQRAMMEQMMRGRMGAAAPPAKTVYSPKGSATVAGFPCSKYEGVRGTEKVVEVCASRPAELKFAAADFQVYEKMKEFTSGLQRAFASMPMMANSLSGLSEAGFEGYPVTKTTFSAGKADKTTELKLLERATFRADDFSVGNAKRNAMPGPRGGR